MKQNIAFLLIVISLLSCNSKKEVKTVDFEQMSMRQLKELIAKDSLNDRLYLEQAKKFFSHKKLPEAIKSLEKASRLNETNLDMLLLLSDWYLMKGQSEKARQTLDEALKVEPNSTDALLKMGVLYSLIDDPLKSFEYLNDALKIDPNIEQIYFYKSLNYCAVKDTDRAITELQKAIEKKPGYTDAYLQLGVIHEERNDTLAQQYYQNAVKVDSLNTLAHYDLALYYQNHDQLGKALSHYRFIINKIDSNFSSALHNMGYVYLIYSDYLDSAVYYFDQAIAIDQDYFQAYSNKGYALELQKDYPAAQRAYEQCLKIKPKHIPAIKGIERIARILN